MSDVSKRPVALVTGGSRGLGRAIVDQLSRDFHVVIGGRSAASVHEVAATLPHASALVADLTDGKDIERAVASMLEDTSGRLDLLVHNAGVCHLDHADGFDRNHWIDSLSLNVVGVAQLTSLLLPALRAQHGQIIMINSGAGLRGFSGTASYCASKFALTGYTQVLREEERGRVRVTSIHPGRIDTDMQKSMHVAMGRDYDADAHLNVSDVARTVRLTVDLPADANIDELSVRPFGK
ncbi:SDR family oxidoreductase [Schaalia vaccimaxillae]|uniref:SDR family oxidoreductase n=1 Tax=Schaalia vaccimaxillae TaxID=183916 RepID=UPI0003B41626|nr:SDR family oxidoreductase [Schaalia vaccimaxillae]